MTPNKCEILTEEDLSNIRTALYYERHRLTEDIRSAHETIDNIKSTDKNMDIQWIIDSMKQDNIDLARNKETMKKILECTKY